MPQIFRMGEYWIYFWTNENKPVEPIHVHIAKGKPSENATYEEYLKRSGRIDVLLFFRMSEK